MNIFRLAFELFVIYLVYKLVFEFIIPVYRTTKEMRQKMSDIQQKMQEQQAPQDRAFNTNKFENKTEASKKAVSDDYIEFEEIK